MTYEETNLTPLDPRSAGTSGDLFVLLLLFQFSFFLQSMLRLFLMLPLALISFTSVTHICFSRK